ncbi:MAG: hypothetical protein ACM34A_20060 [Bacillota bacterium]
MRNIAFYRAGWRHGHVRTQRQFWLGANGAFLDAAVLEWCKAFAEWDGKHHWRRVISDREVFSRGLFDAVAMSAHEFHEYIKATRSYRDKFVAHLDEELVMYIPRMRVARNSAAYLFNYLRRHPKLAQYLVGAPTSAAEFYGFMYRHASLEYARAT